MAVELAHRAAEDDAEGDELESAVIRFAGDSGDGMQVTGAQFTQATALLGNKLATFPDFPAEIRAPVGTTYGVSAFQINFGSTDIMTSGDELDALVAMNPAALVTNMQDLAPGGLLIVDKDQFTDRNLRKAGYSRNPLETGELDKYRLLGIEISSLTLQAVKELGLSNRDALRCKNFWTLGLLLWMYGRKRQPTVDWLKQKFGHRLEIADANIAALNAGHIYAETAELPSGIGRYSVPRAYVEPGLYRTVTGADALAWGLLAGSELAGLRMTFAGYPITPASPLLHILSGLKEFGVITFQAEDEIAACCAAIGASFAGGLGVTSSSGPGIALKGEAIGLAVATELPLVIVDSQRAGPSTGMPTKTEQSDLYLAVFGRFADSPVPVLAAASPSDCFDVAIEAVRIATKYMTPVIVLSDGYIANAAEPWKIPDFGDYEPVPVSQRTDPEDFHPFSRDEKTLARPWAVPGTPGLEHRIGGIERNYETGDISYDPENHQRMTDVRIAKITGISRDIAPQEVTLGEAGGRLAVVGWGSTFGPINRAVTRARASGLDVSHVHVRQLYPLPRNLGDLLRSFDRILVPEMNKGQFLTLLRSAYLLDAEGLSKVSGQPFKIREIEAAIRDRLET